MDFTLMSLTDATATSPPPSGAASAASNPVATTSNEFYMADDNVSSLAEQLYGHHIQPSAPQTAYQHTTPGSNSNTNLGSVVGPQNMAKLRRDSIAHSQGMGGVSWGSLTIGSWLRDEVMFHTNLKNSRSNSTSRNGSINLSSTNAIGTSNSRRPSHYRGSASPPSAYNSYLPNLEKQYCKDYSCCGLSLPGLHDLLRHYEEAHIATSPASTTINIMQANASSNVNSQKRRSYQNAVPTSIPKQQQHLQQGHQQPQKPTHHHIIQQQLNQRNSQQQTPPSSQQNQQQARMTTSPSTIGTTHTSINVTSAGHNSSNATTTTSTNSNASLAQGPQLHLNGNLVDAVSTNDVFLQPNTNNLAQMNRRHVTTQNTANNISMHGGGKIPITPQQSFNAYSLNMPSNKNAQSQSSKMNNAHIHNPNLHLNNSQNKSLKFSNSISNGMEFDFMDEDLIGSDLDDNTPAFMRLGNAGVSHNPHNNLIANTTKNTMINRVHHPTPPPSTTTGTVAPHIMHGEDEDDEDDEEEDEDDEDDDLTTGASNLSQAKNSGRSINRQEGFIHDPARRLYVMDHEEHKPFKCPVIGCDKTYKNQNGLKYHKLHGHQNQKLHENSDGTFSIIDPESNEPYPDGMGYEKDKPYRCEVCGKRYKNLNGLKYHRGHSTH